MKTIGILIDDKFPDSPIFRLDIGETPGDPIAALHVMAAGASMRLALSWDEIKRLKRFLDENFWKLRDEIKAFNNDKDKPTT